MSTQTDVMTPSSATASSTGKAPPAEHKVTIKLDRPVSELSWIQKQIKENQRPMWFSGHSLGGAMAAVCAVRCKISPIPSNPQAIFSYGAPRVGDRTYTSFLKVKHYRWVNNNDIVPRVPPRWLGYRHMGQEIYINRRGRISNLRSWLRVRDRFWGLIASLKLCKLDYFGDHSMVDYIAHIRGHYEDELAGNPIKTPKHIPAE